MAIKPTKQVQVILSGHGWSTRIDTTYEKAEQFRKDLVKAAEGAGMPDIGVTLADDTGSFHFFRACEIRKMVCGKRDKVPKDGEGVS